LFHIRIVTSFPDYLFKWFIYEQLPLFVVTGFFGIHAFGYLCEDLIQQMYGNL